MRASTSCRRQKIQTAIRFIAACALLLLMAAPEPATAYSVLSHEEIVDLAWRDNLVPVLMKRFPQTTPEQLREAHAYAYGGCIIQDIGYYPFGSHLFSDLVHYVRTGDFVENLLRESTDVDEYAFALGALAHYMADSYGHPAVNEATGREYPKLRDKFGNVVTYDDNPTAHLQTEFGFDVVEVAHERYAPQQYHDFIGFSVAKPLLERAFRDTYGFEVDQIMTHEDLAINTYRHTVSGLIPHMTRVAAVAYEKQMKQEDPNYARKRFVYRVNKADYRREYGRDYQKPGPGTRVLAFIIRILPKIGPLRALKLHMPGPESQKEFLASVNTVADHFDVSLKELREGSMGIPLADCNLDTGEVTAEGKYRLADFTYAKLLGEIEKHPNVAVPESLRSNILGFYRDGGLDYVSAKRKQWNKVQVALHDLEGAKPAAVKVSDQSTKDQVPDRSANGSNMKQ